MTTVSSAEASEFGWTMCLGSDGGWLKLTEYVTMLPAFQNMHRSPVGFSVRVCTKPNAFLIADTTFFRFFVCSVLLELECFLVQQSKWHADH
jgi:hypothetical protein